MDFISSFLLPIIIAYLIGSFPTGLILTKIFAKKNIKDHGSGNIGATNVLRVAGKKLGYLTFLLDGLKGLLAVFIGFKMVESDFTKNLIIISAVCGHIFPIWLKFKGGKGVATFILISAYVSPVMFITMVVSWYGVFKMFYIVSLSSIIAMLSVIIFQITFPTPFVMANLIVAFLIIFKHFDNIQRILSGEESSFKKVNDKQ